MLLSPKLEGIDLQQLEQNLEKELEQELPGYIQETQWHNKSEKDEGQPR